MLVLSDGSGVGLASGMDAPVQFGVVLPVHDEEQLLPAALSALDRAIGHVSAVSVAVGIAIVLDACTDRSRDVVAAWWRNTGCTPHGSVHIIETDVGNVGRARRIGFDRLLSTWSEREPQDIWLATTDADSEVPRNWISSQLAVRSEGGQVWAGAVSVSDWSSRRTGTAERWLAEYGAEAQPVHGANLGIEAALYLEAGGFDALPTGEDRDLFERTLALGAVVRHDPTVRVVTSSRRDARAPKGFAHALSSLEALMPPMPEVARPSATVTRLDPSSDKEST